MSGQAYRDMGAVEYLVVLDNDYAIWDAFSNTVHRRGYRRRRTNRAPPIRRGCIRSIKLSSAPLREAGRDGVGDNLVLSPTMGSKVSRLVDLVTPETYLGRAAQLLRLRRPGGWSPYQWSQFQRCTQAISRSRCQRAERRRWAIAFRFHARDVHLVLRAREARQSRSTF